MKKNRFFAFISIIIFSLSSCSLNKYDNEKDCNSELLTDDLKIEIKNSYNEYYLNNYNEKINIQETIIDNICGIYNEKYYGIRIYDDTKINYDSPIHGDKTYDFFEGYFIEVSSKELFLGVYFENNFISIQDAFNSNYIDSDVLIDMANNNLISKV